MICLDSSIESLTERYLLSRDVCADYAAQIRARVRLFSAWFASIYSRLPTIGDLDAETVNEWLATAKDSSLSPWTISGYRRNLLAVWNHAYLSGETDEPPLRLRQIKIPSHPVVAWTLNEIRSLDVAATHVVGSYPNGKRSTYWRAIIHGAYSTGLRRGDLLRIERRQICPDGIVEIVQSKTGQAHRVRVCRHVLELIDELAGNRPFAWPCHRNTFNTHFKALVAAAGIRPGTLRWLRRSAGSYAESLEPGAGARLLGHRDGRVFARFYEDLSITGQSPPTPPEL